MFEKGQYMITKFNATPYIRNDTKDLIAYAEMGISPCKHCSNGERHGCVNSCRAWPVWFSVHWRNLRKQLGYFER